MSLTTYVVAGVAMSLTADVVADVAVWLTADVVASVAASLTSDAVAVHWQSVLLVAGFWRLHPDSVLVT